jgi:hypothetical protein
MPSPGPFCVILANHRCQRFADAGAAFAFFRVTANLIPDDSQLRKEGPEWLSMAAAPRRK